MSEDVDEIRKQKAKEMLDALNNEDDDFEMDQEMMPWAYRFKIQDPKTKAGFFEIMQMGNVVAITQDQRFAEVVTDHLNRLILVMESGILGEEEEWP